MRLVTLVVFFTFLFTNVNSQTAQNKTSKPGKALINKATGHTYKTPLTPDIIWGKLFVDVQLSMALGDNKTFVDAVPKFSKEVILERYKRRNLSSKDSAAIRTFIFEHFKVPGNSSINLPAKTSSLKAHLEQLWPALTRKADLIESNSSLLPLPKAYVVPGGRFREIYYWDSYFTMLGLAASNRYDLIENMLDNFKFLIEKYGHIPNGNRSYYLSRSQPPYFALMVELLYEKMGTRVYKKYFSALQKEYQWWMDGENIATTESPFRRVVKLADGSIVNRYFDDKPTPREESYYQDVQTGIGYKNNDKLIYTHLRAAAESGWDFSSRWFADTMTLNTIETTNIIPVDLNCLLYAYELILDKAARSQHQTTKANEYNQRSNARKKAILTYCWNNEKGYFFDYHFKFKQTTNKWAAAGVLPLFVNIATPLQAEKVRTHIEGKFLKDGGIVTTIYHTGEQWDAPNGWAPLQYLTVKGLLNYKHDSLANTIATRWMTVNEKVYLNTGKMLEKYNVENIQLLSGGGEYPTQDGFGWSNGVYLKFYSMFRKK